MLGASSSDQRNASRAPAKVGMVFAALVCSTALVAVTQPTGSGFLAAAATAGPAKSPPTYSWPELHESPSLDGVSLDPSISTTDASTLGVSWMTGTGAAVLDSPVVGWNAVLGETVVYTANEAGHLIAYNTANGVPVWSDAFGQPMRSSPLIDGAYLWIAPTYSDRLYKLDAATGAVECSTPTPFTVDSSPTLATPPGGSPTVYIGVNDHSTYNGPLMAIDEATCAVDFSVTPELGAGTGGVWDPIAYAVDANGEGLVLFGTADPDAGVYAIDAITGATVWRFQSYNPKPADFDIGAGVTVSAPGLNGFADGVAYVSSKYGITYALDLTTGTEIWSYQFGTAKGTISTAALSGSDLVFGSPTGVLCLDAVTGALLWSQNDGGYSIDASPAIVGPAGSQVVVSADLAGTLVVLSLATGDELYSYQFGNYSVSSPAETDGNILETAADGYIYDFDVGGGAPPAPSTAVTYPAAGSSVANPDGALTLSGTAGGTSGPAVGAVDVDVQSSSTNEWWDGASGTWTVAPYPNPATLSSPDASSSDWSFALPVPAAGGGYDVLASAVTTTGVADISAEQSPPTAARDPFTVQPDPSAPVIELSTQFAAPGSILSVRGSGFDSGETVQISLGETVLADATAGTSGALAATPVTLPSASDFGPSTITATGETSGLSTTADFDIVNTWPAFGDGPLLTSFELNDTTFSKHTSVSPQTYMSQAWSFDTGAAITAPPAVDDGVAYITNKAGDVFAVSVTTGMQLWHHKSGKGVGIDSGPAVDSGLLMYGDSAGALVALNPATGATIWDRSLGTSAVDSSPEASGGVVFVASEGGVVSAVAEGSGQLLWQTNLGSAASAAPAVDATTGLVYEGDEAGVVTALSSSTGAAVWTFTTGGAITAGALVIGSEIYIGSADDDVYELNATSGAQGWTYDAGAPVTANLASAAANGIVVAAGNKVTWLKEASGEKFYVVSVVSDVVGVAAAQGFVVSLGSGGTITGSREADGNSDAWLDTISGRATAPPVLLNSSVYVSGRSGVLTCFTVPGDFPQ
jgi:outer membrane protein assembly factor BamB